MDGSGTAPRWAAGDQVVVRSIWHGRVWTATPATVVQDAPDLVALHITPGSRRKMPRAEMRDLARLALAGEWELTDREWTGGDALMLFVPGDGYAALAQWTPPPRTFAGWYINLQEPPRRAPLGFDTLDLALDIVASPDRARWSWKDEDAFAEAQVLGLITPDRALAIRAEGERAIALLLAGRPPFEAAWECWIPEPAWPAPQLPAGWERAAYI